MWPTPLLFLASDEARYITGVALPVDLGALAEMSAPETCRSPGIAAIDLGIADRAPLRAARSAWSPAPQAASAGRRLAARGRRRTGHCRRSRFGRRARDGAGSREPDSSAASLDVRRRPPWPACRAGPGALRRPRRAGQQCRHRDPRRLSRRPSPMSGMRSWPSICAAPIWCRARSAAASAVARARARRCGDRPQRIADGAGLEPAAGGLLRFQGRRGLADPEHGARPCRRGRPRELRLPGDHPYAHARTALRDAAGPRP